MKKRSKIILVSLVFLSMLVVLGEWFLSTKAERSIEEALGPGSNFENVNVNILQNKILVERPQVTFRSGKLTASKAVLEGLHIGSYVLQDSLVFDQVSLEKPELVLTRKKDTGSAQGSKRRSLRVKLIEVSDGVVRFRGQESGRDGIFIGSADLNLYDFRVNEKTLDEPVPFRYGEYHLQIDSVTVGMNPEHYVTADRVTIKTGKTAIKDFRIVPKFEKKDFDRRVPFEKDRISLRIERVALDSLTFGFLQDSLVLRNPVMRVSKADLWIYRNRLLSDDPRQKALYSRRLRQSPVKMDFEEIHVDSSQVVYEEKVQQQGELSRVLFRDLNGRIKNVKNIHFLKKDLPRTYIKAKALFMGKTPVNLDWSFSVENPGSFRTSGSFGSIRGRELNSFLKPSLQIKAAGKINSVDFSFVGNQIKASGEVLMAYDRFKISVMNDSGEEQKDIFSALANLFVDNDGFTGKRELKVTFTRDTRKSFWNYLWKGLKKALIEALGQF